MLLLLLTDIHFSLRASPTFYLFLAILSTSEQTQRQNKNYHCLAQIYVFAYLNLTFIFSCNYNPREEDELRERNGRKS